jgi:hypothetical protein
MSSPSGNLPNGKIAFGLSIFIFLYKLCVQMHLAKGDTPFVIPRTAFLVKTIKFELL